MRFTLFCLLSLVILASIIEAKKTTLSLKKKPSSRLTSRSVDDVSLGGNIPSEGAYYVSITVGTPPQIFNVQIDTGSSDLAIPSSSCFNCTNQKQRTFDTSLSGTLSVVDCNSNSINCPKCGSNNQCTYNNTYGDGSGYIAEVYSDVVTLGGLTTNSQIFGLITSEHGSASVSTFEPTNVDGILGLAYRALSNIDAVPVFDNLVSSTGIDNAFSICLDSNGGALTLGGDGGFHTGSFVYTPITNSNYYYTVYLDDIQANSTSLSLSAATYNSGSFGTVIDSGTTYLSVSQVVYDAFQTYLESRCSSVDLVGVCNVASGNTFFKGFCYNLTNAELNQFPSLTFVFGSNNNSQIQVEVPPTSYLIQGVCTDSTSSYGFIFESSESDGNIILGEAFMQFFEVLFDRAHGQIGFAPVNSCGSLIVVPSASVTPTPNFFTVAPSPSISGASLLSVSLFLVSALLLTFTF